ncbi:MAG: C4-dicarboxylate ABC transporter [Acidobacteria bacterium]|nr:C4-dicarboxylate ABC transporter [Acidobacteriota bacterium]
MNLAWISVGALVLAVTLSCTTTINVGILSMSLALIVGVGLGGMTPGAVLEGLPTDLLVTLIGVTLLFSIAECNGTLARLTARAVKACRGQAGLLPIMFFLVGFVIATIGAGATPASALLAPPAMAVAGRAGIPPFLMAIMAGNGALAGTLSPFAPTGIVAHGVMARIGLGGVEWQTFAYNALAHAAVGVGGFLLFGGWKLFVRRDGTSQAAEPDLEPMDARHWTTVAGIVALIGAVAGFNVNVGMAALIIATTLVLLRTVNEAQAIQHMPWGVILMVSGVTVLISLLQETKGMELFAAGLANISTPATVAPIVAFGTGIVSVYSSTSGVVLPAFLPLAPALAERVGGGMGPLPIAWSMNVGASLVDLSSLSTVGALFMAGAAPGTDTRKLFNALLAWGLSMSVVGGVVCWVLFG